MSDYKNIIVEKKDQVDWVTLNRPESLNSITTPMVTELRDYFGNLMENDSTRIVVLRGAGTGFCMYHLGTVLIRSNQSAQINDGAGI